MTTLEGNIKKITTEANESRYKKTITLQMGKHNTVFVEFQGRTAEWLNKYSEGDRVSVRVRFNGKTSSTGHSHNNIIGKSINTINH